MNWCIHKLGNWKLQQNKGHPKAKLKLEITVLQAKVKSRWAKNSTDKQKKIQQMKEGLNILKLLLNSILHIDLKLTLHKILIRPRFTLQQLYGISHAASTTKNTYNAHPIRHNYSTQLEYLQYDNMSPN